jgi:hypothetical protein
MKNNEVMVQNQVESSLRGGIRQMIKTLENRKKKTNGIILYGPPVSSLLRSKSFHVA